MKFGHFDDLNREYVIERPDTPLPWINYLGMDGYFALISNTAGGYSFYKDARLRRLTRYRYNNVPYDTGGRYQYIRDNTDGEFWSPSWQPVRKSLERYTCRHGMGYTVIQSTYEQIESKTRYFVPLNQSLEIWDTEITNHRDKTASLSLFSLVEFALWDAADDATNFQRNFNIGEVEVVNGVIYHKTEYRERRDHFAYFACSVPLAGFDTQRSAFLGQYNGWDKPDVVVNGVSTNSIAHGWAPIGSHHLNFELAPGETKRIIFLLGYQENPRDAKFDPADSQTINKVAAQATITQFLDPAQVDESFGQLAAAWDKNLNLLKVETLDIHVDRMVNIWNAYQCMVTFNLSRSASYFESGVGRGMGFRDSSQDILGFVHMLPSQARERLLDLAATQLKNGGAYHQYQPLTKRGNEMTGGNFNDDPQWFVIGVSAYLKETGDFSILEELVPYENEPGSEKSLFDHLKRALQYTLDRLGPHGLPLIGRADWNDCLNLNTFSSEPGESFQTATSKEGLTAESIFIAITFTLVAQEMAAIARQLGESAEAEYYDQVAADMHTTTLEHGWDGEWFRRAYDDFGNPVGSHLNTEGKIFIEPQGLAVMAGIGVKTGEAAKALASVNKHLATKHGIVLLQPAFTKYQIHLGEISSYPPGYKENAGIFCHNNPWIAIAEAILGNGEQALDYYLRINPSMREDISEIHRCEPYIYAQMIAGKDAPTHGEAKNSWLTGTAAWNYVAITQWILGVRPSFNGLVIAPVIPAEWKGFKVSRHFRGVRYDITSQRTGPGNDVSLTVDGVAIPGNTIPLPAVGITSVEVHAQLGS